MRGCARQPAGLARQCKRSAAQLRLFQPLRFTAHSSRPPHLATAAASRPSLQAVSSCCCKSCREPGWPACRPAARRLRLSMRMRAFLYSADAWAPAQALFGARTGERWRASQASAAMAWHSCSIGQGCIC